MTLTAIMGTIFGSSLLLFVYPYLIYPLILRCLSKRPVRLAPVDLPTSLLFCAYNERKGLPAKLDNLRELKQRRPQLQILAYDDGSSDGTFELLAGEPDLLTVIRGPGRTGKAAGMKQLVKQASGEILVFTDADALISPDTIDRLLPYFADPEIGGVCGVLRCSAGDSVTAQVGSLYWSLDEELRRLESETGNVMGAWGSLFSVRRSLYPEFPDTVADDFTVSMSVILQGKRLVRAPDVAAFHESVVDRGEEMRRKVRIGARAYHTHGFLRPQLHRIAMRDKFKYLSRKQIRWFGGLFLGIAAASGLGLVATVSVYAALLLAAAVIAAALLTRRSRIGYLAKGNEALLLIFATFAGVMKAMRGQTVTTWAPAKTR